MRTALLRIRERLRGMADQIGHPDYSLAELRTSLYHAASEIDAAQAERESISHTDHPLRHWDRTCPACLADSEQNAAPIVVTLCGSTKFKTAFESANLSETLAGRIVLSVGGYAWADKGQAGEEVWGIDTKKMLDQLHFRKIDLSDEILVLNVGGYIGTSCRNEINYAAAHGKRVRYLEQNAEVQINIAPPGPVSAAPSAPAPSGAESVLELARLALRVSASIGVAEWYGVKPTKAEVRFAKELVRLHAEQKLTTEVGIVWGPVQYFQDGTAYRKGSSTGTTLPQQPARKGDGMTALEAALEQMDFAGIDGDKCDPQGTVVPLGQALDVLRDFAAALREEIRKKEIEPLKMQLDLTRADYLRDRVRMEQVVTAETIAHRAEHRANQAESERDELRKQLATCNNAYLAVQEVNRGLTGKLKQGAAGRGQGLG